MPLLPARGTRDRLRVARALRYRLLGRRYPVATTAAAVAAAAAAANATAPFCGRAKKMGNLSVRMSGGLRNVCLRSLRLTTFGISAGKCRIYLEKIKLPFT
jgi:hypothetical protein